MAIALWSRLRAAYEAALSPVAKPSTPQWSFQFVRNPYTDDFFEFNQYLNQPVVYACIRAIASTIGMLPWDVIEKVGTQRKNVQPVEDDVSWILDVQPNPEMSAMTFRETLLMHALTWGNGFAEIQRDGMGRVKWLWPIEPDRVRPDRDKRTGELIYVVNNPFNDGYGVLAARDMFHLKGLGYDGLTGYSVISLAATTLKLAASAENYAANFYSGGGLPAGILEVPGIMQEQRRKELGKAWDENYGLNRRGKKTAVLEAGTKYTPITMPNTDAEFLATRKFAVTDICRWFGVPPHMVYDLENAHYNNIEQQQIEFVQHSLLPWTIRLEQEANIKLMGRNQQGRRFTKVNVMGLLRGDMKSRSAFYREMISIGVMSVNEVRELEDRNGIGPQGDEHYMQVNMTTLDRIMEGENNQPESSTTEGTTDEGQQPAADVEAEDDDDEPTTGQLSKMFLPLATDVFERLRRKESHIVAALTKKHGLDAERVGKDFLDQWAKANPAGDSPLRVLAASYLRAGTGRQALEAAVTSVCATAMERYSVDAADRVRAAAGGSDVYTDGTATSIDYAVTFVGLCQIQVEHDCRENEVCASVSAG